MRDSFRRQMAESVMEGIGANSIFFISQPLLAGYATGAATCTVVDCGYTYTSVMGMLNFYPVPESQLLLPLGGRDLDRYLMHLSPKALRQLSTEEVAYIKRHYCSVAPTLTSTSLRKRTTCILPDGSQITLSSELQMGSEMLFNPSLAGLADVPPVDQSIIDAVFSVPDNRAYTLLRMVFSSGGSLKLPGFSSRLKQCLLNRTASKLLDTVKKNPHSELSVWWGGSVFASLSTFKKMCITRAEYEEEGPGIVSNRWL
nr:unnamed protein product [Spirometra erinaceieuropaei]